MGPRGGREIKNINSEGLVRKERGRATLRVRGPLLCPAGITSPRSAFTQLGPRLKSGVRESRNIFR